MIYLNLDVLEKWGFPSRNSKFNFDKQLNRTIKRKIRGHLIEILNFTEEEFDSAIQRVIQFFELNKTNYSLEPVTFLAANKRTLSLTPNEVLNKFCKAKKKESKKGETNWWKSKLTFKTMELWKTGQYGTNFDGKFYSFQALEEKVASLKAHLIYSSIYGVIIARCYTNPCDLCKDRIWKEAEDLQTRFRPPDPCECKEKKCIH